MAYAGHDVHGQRDVGRIGDLHAYLANRPADWSHAERDDKHGPAVHAASELIAKRGAHFIRRNPVVERPGVFLTFRADERPIFYPRHVGRIAASEVAARPLLLIKLDQRAGAGEVKYQGVILVA